MAKAYKRSGAAAKVASMNGKTRKRTSLRAHKRAWISDTPRPRAKAGKALPHPLAMNRGDSDATA